MPTGKDQRKHRRYNLSLPVTMSSKKPGAAPLLASSRDISAGGMYLRVSKDCELGSTLELEVDIPQALTQSIPVRIRCRGVIIRVDKLNQENVGIAAQIEKYQFIREDGADKSLSQPSARRTAQAGA